MALDPKELAKSVLIAVKPVLGKSWDEVRSFAEGEAIKLAQMLITIGELRATDQIDEDQARALLDMQKHAMQAVLLTVEGIGIITAQNAINAALSAVKVAVNGALGFALI
jgi:hypothetical protein